MSSGTISEKSNEQIDRNVQKCWFWVQKWFIYPNLCKIRIFLRKYPRHFLLFIES